MMWSYVDLHFTVKVIKKPMQRNTKLHRNFNSNEYVKSINTFPLHRLICQHSGLKLAQMTKTKVRNQTRFQIKKFINQTLSLSPPLSWLLFFSIAFIYVFLVWANPLKMKIWLSGCGYLTFCTNRFTIPLNHRQSSNRNAERAKNTHCTHTAKTHKPFR